MFYNCLPVDEYNMVATYGQIRVENDRFHQIIIDVFGVHGEMEPK